MDTYAVHAHVRTCKSATPPSPQYPHAHTLIMKHSHFILSFPNLQISCYQTRTIKNGRLPLMGVATLMPIPFEERTHKRETPDPFKGSLRYNKTSPSPSPPYALM